MTPLVSAARLGAQIGSRRLYIKNDAVNFPTLSFKDRVVAVALANAKAFGFQTVSCSSTGNLANAVAAQAARQGLDAWIFIPADLEPAKILGTQIFGARLVRIAGNYDQVNRLCSQIGERFHWGFVTSISARITPKARRPSATKSPSSSAGACPTTSSSPWPADR